MKLGQDYNFTGICHSVNGGGGGAIPACIAGDIPACLEAGLQKGGSAPGGMSAPGGCLLWGVAFCYSLLSWSSVMPFCYGLLVWWPSD